MCDPACGSGHFLVAAARRIAKALAQARHLETEPTPTQLQAAIRDVVGRCIHGVDLNPMAAELAKVSLWLEALEPGKPLAFLDANIRVGNALLGTTPALLAQGIPDEAYTALTGDDKTIVTALRKRNKVEREQAGHRPRTARHVRSPRPARRQHPPRMARQRPAPAGHRRRWPTSTSPNSDSRPLRTTPAAGTPS